MSNSKAATSANAEQSAVNVDADKKNIGSYLKSREGKRWRTEDTRAILARAAEIDRMMERLMIRSGIAVVGSSEPEINGNFFAFSTAAHVS